MTSTSADETVQLGQRLGRLLRDGDVVGLVGNLGAGKTQLARGMAMGAGVDSDEVSSPTFSIVQSYRGRLTLHHADLYRLSSRDELAGVGLNDLLDEGGAAVIEWAEQVPRALGEEWLRVELTRVSETERRIDASAFGARAERLLRDWLG